MYEVSMEYPYLSYGGDPSCDPSLTRPILAIQDKAPMTQAPNTKNLNRSPVTRHFHVSFLTYSQTHKLTNY